MSVGFFTLRGDRPPTLDSVSPQIAEVCSRHPDVEAAGVFGSVARGEARPDSDVDVFALFDGEVDHRRVLEVEGELSRAMGGQVDLLTGFDCTTPLFRASFERDAVTTYERG